MGKTTSESDDAHQVFSNAMQVKVSVVLPTYNRSASVVDAARSVLQQSFRDLELLIVDDASSEDIEAVVAGLGDARVRYLRHEKNAGAAAARNTGVAAAQGELIAFQDSDDLWLPGKLARQVALLEAQGPDVGVVTGCKVLYGRDLARVYGPGRVACAPDPGRLLRLDEDQLKRSLLDCRISLQNALFRRDCVPAGPWFDATFRANEDWDFTIRLAQNTLVLEDAEPVVFAQISHDSISIDPRAAARSYIRLLRKHRETFAGYPREQGEFLFLLGRRLIACGRKRIGRRVLLRSLSIRPQNGLKLGGALLRRALAVPGRLVRETG
ncbi:MAG: glycosyltransferase family 2 protein [Pseudomonadota bacterium]